MYKLLFIPILAIFCLATHQSQAAIDNSSQLAVNLPFDLFEEVSQKVMQYKRGDVISDDIDYVNDYLRSMFSEKIGYENWKLYLESRGYPSNRSDKLVESLNDFEVQHQEFLQNFKREKLLTKDGMGKFIEYFQQIGYFNYQDPNPIIKEIANVILEMIGTASGLKQGLQITDLLKTIHESESENADDLLLGLTNCLMNAEFLKIILEKQYQINTFIVETRNEFADDHILIAIHLDENELMLVDPSHTKSRVFKINMPDYYQFDQDREVLYLKERVIQQEMIKLNPFLFRGLINDSYFEKKLLRIEKEMLEENKSLANSIVHFYPYLFFIQKHNSNLDFLLYSYSGILLELGEFKIFDKFYRSGKFPQQKKSSYHYFIVTNYLKELAEMNKISQKEFRKQLLEVYLKQWELNPYASVNGYNLSYWYYSQGQLEKAIEVIEKSIASDPYVANYRILMGKVLLDSLIEGSEKYNQDDMLSQFFIGIWLADMKGNLESHEAALQNFLKVINYLESEDIAKALWPILKNYQNVFPDLKELFEETKILATTDFAQEYKQLLQSA